MVTYHEEARSKKTHEAQSPESRYLLSAYAEGYLSDAVII